MAELLSKISAKTVGADPSVAKGKDQTVRFPLFKVFGVCRSLIVKKDSDGNLQSGLKGQFQAINAQEGSTLYGTLFDSAVCYLPGGIQAMIEEAVEHQDPESGEVRNTPAEFALEIYATAAANKIGYTYGATYLANPSAADPMAKLREQALSKGAQVKLIAGQVAEVAAIEAPKAEAPAGKEKAPA